jgi:hypothetical protein
MVSFTLVGSDVVASDFAGVHVINGTVDAVQHSRINRGGGGGSSGGGASAVGGGAPTGDGDVGGGGQGSGGAVDTNNGGGLIGNENDFNWPTANSGSWTNAANAYDQVDGTYTTTNTSTTNDFSAFANGVPSSDAIGGIAVKLEISGTTAAGDIGVELSWNGGSNYTTSGKTTGTLTTTDSVVVLGSSSDLWGRSWSPAELSDENFRVHLTGNPSSNEIRVDGIQVKVYHQATGGNQGGGSGSGGGAI